MTTRHNRNEARSYPRRIEFFEHTRVIRLSLAHNRWHFLAQGNAIIQSDESTYIWPDVRLVQFRYTRAFIRLICRYK